MTPNGAGCWPAIRPNVATPPSATASRAPDMAVWTPDELAAFLEATNGHHHAALFRLAALTGLRRGEVAGLRWGDINLDRATLTVRHTIGQVGRRVVQGEPKTARGRRTVALDPVTVDVLRGHRRTQAEQRLLIGAGWHDHDLVFASPTGEPWAPDSISQAFDRAVARSGLPALHFHGLRHPHASHLLATGVNVKIVSERLGHASVSFTLDVYGHTMPGQQAGAAAAVATLVDRR